MCSSRVWVLLGVFATETKSRRAACLLSPLPSFAGLVGCCYTLTRRWQRGKKKGPAGKPHVCLTDVIRSCDQHYGVRAMRL
ncbi:hypothetical protein B0T25DRAFT_548556 [Lasiosphaeria hispida]|uniref:Uncharacterized protein n=1 Tax=Lasiosphaeria hispida TaxID=260671 RepID=A0AAJ0MCI0_9PEZI|nr:hypothetical protein B0T25DRAFT_548556 [Lasiosphaeria hispida]